MAITILNDMGCNLSPRPGEATSSEQVAFHRHCQATILSAYGPGGNGATWSILSELDLPHINSNWKDMFTGNQTNITEDLKSILLLIDQVAEDFASNFTIGFKCEGESAAYEKFNFNQANANHTFTVGRNITLNVNGMNLKFNTARKANSENLSIELPTNTLSIKYNGESIGSAQVTMPQSEQIDLPINNLTLSNGRLVQESIPLCMPNNNQLKIVPTTIPGNRVSVRQIYIGSDDYIYHTACSSSTFQMNLILNPTTFSGFLNSSKNGFSTSSYGSVITFEVHIRNVSNADKPGADWNPEYMNKPSTISSIQVWIAKPGYSSSNVPTDDTCYNVTSGLKVVELTDLKTIEPGQTNAYVFRISKRFEQSYYNNDTKPTMTMSLAYIY